MRLLCVALCAFSLLTQLPAQTDPVSLGLNLEVGSSYLLEVQQKNRFFKSPEHLAYEKKNFTKNLSFQQRSKRYLLHVLEQKGDVYSVELILTLVQTYTAYDQFSIQIADRGSDFDISYIHTQDTVHFTMDRYARVTDVAMPDSIFTGYAMPDKYRVEVKKVMPELVDEFTAFFDFLRPQPTSVGDTWLADSGKTFTLAGRQANFWSIRCSDDRQIYLDPQTNWIRFVEQHQIGISSHHRRFPGKTETNQLIKGRTVQGAQMARISGTAPGHRNGSFLMRTTPYYRGYDAEHLIEVDADGHFAWEGKITEPFYFQLTDLYDHNFWGYARPGGALRLHFENQDYSVEGATEEECRYLNAFFETFPNYENLLQLGGDRKNSNFFYEQQLEQSWKDHLQERTAAIEQLAEWHERLDPEFVAAQKRQIDYLRAGLLNKDLSLHYVFRARAGNNTYVIPGNYVNYLDDQILYNNFDRSLPAFRALLHLNLQRKLLASTSGDIINIISRPYESSYYFAQLQYKNYPLYRTTYDLMNTVIRGASQPDQVRYLYQHFLDTQAFADTLHMIEETYRRMKQLQTAGEAVPTFNAFDQLGQNVQLQGLKGSPVVLVLVEGKNYWQNTLMIEDTPKLLPDVQFVFLHIGKPDEENNPLPAFENVHQWFAGRNSAAVSQTFMHYSNSKHPRAYLIDRKGNTSGIFQGDERYDDGILAALYDLRAGSPLVDKQTQKAIFLIMIGLLAGGLIIGLSIHQWQKRLHRREYAKRQQVESQLQVIRSQLNPHFMFNSMSSIQHLIKSGQADRAQSYLGKLANLLRVSLRYTRENFISLQEELDMIKKYCELEALRFNFSFDLQIEERLDPRIISIPPLLLQPYVENAVHHGIAPLRDSGKLTVNISEQGHLLWIRIRDNGQGLNASRSSPYKGNGIGLQLNAERLRLVYGKEAEVKIYSPSPLNSTDLHSGTEVQIAMPMDV
ncbi:MAG: histidine kinase [Saprospiraceae bacterium]|nr:histidine kinase [Lewinella sp.]